MQPFRDRLKLAAEHAKVEYSQTAIARSLGLARKQTVDRWMGDGAPSPKMLSLIADAWKVELRWLATGEGGMLPSAAQQSTAVYAVSEEKINPSRNRGLSATSDAQKMFVLIRTFLDTDDEGRLELLKAARIVAREHAAARTGQARRVRTKRR